MNKFLIGLILSAETLTAAFAQSSDDGSWRVVKTKNKIDARSECSLVAVNEKLYLIGGDGPAEPVEVYDPKTNEWTEKAMAPFPMHHFQAVAYGDKIYVLDAFYKGGFPLQTPMPNSYCYDTKTDRWENLAEIHADRRRAGAGAAVYNGKLYLVCGITHGHSSGTNAMFDEYNPATDTWKALPDAPHIRDHSMAVVVGDKLYAIGGRNTSLHDANNFMSFFDKVVLAVDCYDFKTGTWSTLPAKLPMGTGGGTAVNLYNKIYYIGGERATATIPNHSQKDVYYLDPIKPYEWIQTADLNFARNGVGGTVLNHKIYIAGGSDGSGGSPPNGNGAGIPPPPERDTPGGDMSNEPNGPPPGPRPNGPQGYIDLEVFTLR
jgi:N-acetylneuraminic acid mutarotase